MNIVVSRSQVSSNITGKIRKYCIECRLYFEPMSLQQDPHASHYSWFLPLHSEDLDSWFEKIRRREEQVWGYILDEDGTRSRVFCPSEFTLEVVT